MSVLIALGTDTGASNTDRVTANDALKGTAEAGSVVTLWEGATSLGTATANAGGTWSFTPTSLSQGAHTIVASETDLSGNVGSASLSFVYDTVAETPTAAPGASTNQLTGTAEPFSTVVVTYQGTATLASNNVTPNSSWGGDGIDGANWAGVRFSLSGTHVLTNFRFDSFYDVPTSFQWEIFQGTPDATNFASRTVIASGTVTSGITSSSLGNYQYSVSFSLPNVQISGGTYWFAIHGADQGAWSANSYTYGGYFYYSAINHQYGYGYFPYWLTGLSTQVLGTATADASGNWSLTATGLSGGTYSFSVTETDLAGNVSSSVPLSAVISPVTLLLGTDTSRGHNVSSVATLTGSGSANAIVTIYEGTSVFATVTAGAGGLWSYTPTSLADGSHTFVAEQTAGSATLSFVYDTTPPSLSMGLLQDTGSSSADLITSNDALTGTADAGQVVTLWEGTTSLGTTTADSGGTWNFTPASLADGTHTIVAVETDQAGNVGSTSLTFTYSTTPPVSVRLTLDSGESSADLFTSNDALTGTAEAGLVVTLWEGATSLGMATADATGSWSFTPTSLSDGAHTIEAVATDSVGNVGSASLSFTYDTLAYVSVGLQVDTGASSSDRVTSNDALTGTAEAGRIVTLWEGTASLGTATANAGGTWSFTPTALSDGTHTVIAVEADLAGNVGSASLSFTYDTISYVSLGLQADTGASSSDRVTSNDALTGTAEAGRIVTLWEGAASLGTATADADGTWSFTPTALSDGTHTVLAVDTDLAGNVGSASLTFIYDTTAYVSIGLDVDTGSSETDQITNNDTLLGTAEAGQIVTLWEGSASLGTATADADGTWNFTPTSLSDGTYTIVAVETDLAGNAGSASFTFTYDTTPPTVVIALGTDTGSFGTDLVTSSDALRGTAEEGGVVTLYDGTSVLGTTTADSNGTWSFSPTSLSDGTHTVVAAESDLAGNVGSASLTFTFDTTPPVPVMGLRRDTGASSSDLISAQSALQGAGEPGDVITISSRQLVWTTVSTPLGPMPAQTWTTVTLGTVTVSASGTWSFTPTGLADGTYTLYAAETDLAGNIGTSALTFVYDTHAPTVEPRLANDTGASARDNISRNSTLTGTTDPYQTVWITEGTTVLGSAIADANGAWSFTPANLSQGSHTLIASATDLAGNVGSHRLNFVFDTESPILSIQLGTDTGISSTDRVTAQAALRGAGQPGLVVTLAEGTTVLGMATVNSTGMWTFTPQSLAQGPHTITATETDIAGNTSLVSLNFTYNSVAPHGYKFVPATGSLAALQGTTGLTAGQIGTIVPLSPIAGDTYALTPATGTSAQLALTTNSNQGSLTARAGGLAGSSTGQLYSMIVGITDTTNGLTHLEDRLGIVVGTSAANTINVSTVLGRGAVGPAIIYGLGGADQLNGTGVSSQLWFVGGAGADKMTGGVGSDTYLYGVASESTSAAMDNITNFDVSKDLLDFTGLGMGLTVVGQLAKGATTLGADSVGWRTEGSNTFVYVNTSGSGESLSATGLGTDMRIQLQGMVGLSAGNIAKLSALPPPP